MNLTNIQSQPGIQRDGTKFHAKAYTDGTWCRFQRGMPRKMAGYRRVTNQMAEIVYGMYSFTVNNTTYLHLGSGSLLGQRRINQSGVQTGFDDRTPAGFTPSADNIWQFDAIYDVDVGDTILVASVAPNMDIATDDAQPVYYGLLTGNTLLVNTTYEPVSGGVVTVGNYVVAYGSGGYVEWNTVPNNIDAGVDEDNVTQQKIVKGLTVRGGGVPAALLWSLDSLLIMSLNSGGTPLWDFDTIGEISVMSARAIIEYDGVYYWPGVDRWLSYNGVIREINNTFNVNFFFDNLNPLQRSKVFAYKVPRFGEIWWCFPLGADQEECNHAVIYNVREGYWYDTELPNTGRSDGVYAKVYFKPFMTGIVNEGSGYNLWEHEKGYDEVAGDDVEPIASHFETSEISLISGQQPEDATLQMAVIEPDFVQEGDLTMTVKGRANARSAVIEDPNPRTITPQLPTPAGVTAEEQVSRVTQTHRLISVKFESNEPGGNYEMGQVVAHVNKSGGRFTQ